MLLIKIGKIGWGVDLVGGGSEFVFINIRCGDLVGYLGVNIWYILVF